MAGPSSLQFCIYFDMCFQVKVRARLSRPLQKGRGKFGRRVEYLRTERTASRGGRFSWSRPLPYRTVGQSSRPVGGRGPIGIRGVERPTDFKSRRPIMGTAERMRQLPPPGRSYDRRPPPSKIRFA